MGWNNPLLFDLRGHEYPADWAELLTICCAGMLFLVPLTWIAMGRAIDFFALQLILNGLILIGYFLLKLTAPAIFGAEKKILTAGEQVVAINAVGFFTLIVTLAGCYVFLTLRGAHLEAERSSVPEFDRRLRMFLLPVLMAVIGMTALPMVLTGTIPGLLPDPMVGRGILEHSSLGRPFYNLASSLLPAVVSASLVLALRRPTFVGKFLSLEMAFSGVALGIQYLTSNRLPIALTLLMFCSLWSTEKKRARSFLVVGAVVFIVAYLGLSGLSSILRQSREMLDDGSVAAAAFREAFLGDNLSDLRDGAWVLGSWDYVPLNGTTYLGAITSLMPSAIFPEKKNWYLGLVALRIVQWPTEEHFGLRISFFAESFLNFGLAGVVGLGVLIGSLGGYLLKKLHLSVSEPVPSLARNLTILLSMQLVLAFSESSQGFVFYSLTAFLVFMGIYVRRPVRLRRQPSMAAIHQAT